MMNSDDQDLNTEEAWWYICVITRALYNSLHEVGMKQQCYTHTPKKNNSDPWNVCILKPPPLPPFSFILLKIWFGPINSLIWLKTLHEAISLKMTDFKKRRLVPPLLTVWRNSTISTIVKGILLSPISTYISFYPLISLLNFPIIFGYFTTHFIPCRCHYWMSNQKFFPFGYQPSFQVYILSNLDVLQDGQWNALLSIV